MDPELIRAIIGGASYAIVYWIGLGVGIWLGRRQRNDRR